MYSPGQRPLAPAPAPATAPAREQSPTVLSHSLNDSSLNAAAHALVGARGSSSTAPASASAGTGKQPPPKKQRRSKVAEACKFCRRSHMSCDAGRPCSRCVKRDIAHLCRDEPPGTGGSSTPASRASPVPQSAPAPTPPLTSSAPMSANMLGLASTSPNAAAASLPTYSSSPSTASPALAQPQPPPQQQHALASLTSQAPANLSTMSFAPTHDGSNGAMGYSTSQAQMPMLSNNFNLAMVSLVGGHDFRACRQAD